MENQHKKITGYRDLSQAEIDAMNDAKELGSKIDELIQSFEKDPATDKRWLAIAKTDLQKGLMSLVRSVAKPESF